MCREGSLVGEADVSPGSEPRGGPRIMVAESGRIGYVVQAYHRAARFCAWPRMHPEAVGSEPRGGPRIIVAVRVCGASVPPGPAHGPDCIQRQSCSGTSRLRPQMCSRLTAEGRYGRTALQGKAERGS